MSRSAKIIPTEQNGHNAGQEQLSLFAPRKTEEKNGTIKKESTAARIETKSMARTKKSSSNYSAADIQVLEGIAAIRHRPGMYIGSTSATGLLHLIWEALDNAVDEAVAGYGKNIWVSVDREGWVTVRDEARGMPFDMMLYQGEYLPAATVILTVPHSGGKFEEGVYKTAGGLHGVGATVINALSEKLELSIWKDGQEFRQVFSRGTALPHTIESANPKEHGTILRWRYDH